MNSQQRTRRQFVLAAAATPIASLPAGLVSRAAAGRPLGCEAPAPVPIGSPEGDLQVVILPDDGMAPLLQFIASATRHLDLYVFDLQDASIERALAEAAGRGVAVRALVEPSPGGRKAQAWAVTSRLRRAGVHARPASSVFRKTHAKALLADAARAWIGSANFTGAWRWMRDYAVVTARPATVRALAALFESDWAMASLSRFGAVHREAALRCTPDPASALVVSPSTGRKAVVALIRGAKRSLHIEHSRLDDPQILGVLTERSRAGVVIHTVLDSSAANERARRVLRKQAWASRARLVSAPAIHAKVLVADEQRMLLGSHNLTRESLDERREIGVVVEDAAAVSRVVAALLEDLERRRNDD
jgi:phosphatidylserine/phosphatidylglycerophosphate/cardiolipin synthase-like enzyme